MVRLLTLKTAWLMDTVGNQQARTEIAAIKVAAPQVALKVIDRAIQVHGGGGVSDDFPLALSYAHLRTLRLADGPDEVHKRTIARRELRRWEQVAETPRPAEAVAAMAGDLTGRTAIVTGASRGIGLAIAAALAAAGANVVLTSRNRDAAEAAAVSLGAERVAGYAAHAADEDAAAALRRVRARALRQRRHPGQQRGHQPRVRAGDRPGPRALRQDVRHQPVGADPVDPAGVARVDGRARRHGGQHRLARRPDREPEPRHLQRDQGRADPPHQAARARARTDGAGQRAWRPASSAPGCPRRCGRNTRGRRRRRSRRSAGSANPRTSRAPSPSWPPIARAGSPARRW